MGVMGALLLSIILLVAIVGVGTARIDLYKEGSHSSEAIFKLPNSSIEVVLERRNIHLFLPEYERTLVLRVNGTEVHRLGAAVDTGGYSRMNVHRKSSHEYFLSGELSFDRYL